MNRRSRKYLFVLSGAICLFLLATGILVIAGLRDHLGTADVALVLGSKVQVDGTPSPRLRARLDRTLELYREGYFPSVIVSGGTGDEGYDEAAVMRDYLVSHGIPAEHVIVDSGGTTTFVSAKNTIQIARQHRLESVFVVSQYFHLPRARLALERFGVPTIYSAHAHFFELRDIYSSPRELIGYVSYLFRHYDSATTNASNHALQRIPRPRDRSVRVDDGSRFYSEAFLLAFAAAAPAQDARPAIRRFVFTRACDEFFASLSASHPRGDRRISRR